MKSFAFALTTLYLASAQIEDLIPDDLKGNDEYDETLSDIWPKRTEENIEVIPKGSTEDNAEGFWLSSQYVSIEALTGELSFEISMTLHSPEQNDNWIYMMWF